ncbi:leishmanolysin-like peptidase [Tigriopus californicus]|uniref:leishmanolysin-like peptidase n=1 Tax=Tigriopus californicus TaxID=6832 RepID=UPI0027DA1DE5|nr:leishmanolysin-like peptidase [Tigriopus californicus]
MIGKLLLAVAVANAFLVISIHTHPVEQDGGDFHVAQETHCVHDFPKIEDIPHPVQLKSVNSKRDKRSPEHQMRIQVFYHKSVDELSKIQQEIVRAQIVPNAVSFWENALKVRRNVGAIHLNRKCENNQYFMAEDDPTQYCKNQCVETKCGEFVVPEEHLKSCHTCDSFGRDCKKVTDEGPGVNNTDFVLYVSAIPTKQCGESIGEQASTVAYAAHCQQEIEFDRPVAGHTNICPAAIKPDEVQGLSSTFKHELLHALGFSSSLFAFFRDSRGDPLTPRGSDGKPPINRKLQLRQWSDKIIKEIERTWKVRSGMVTRRVSVMVTPKVVEEVRKHFGCPTLEGAELEDQGGDGTALTHWEKRIFQNEAMTGTVHTQNPVYSRMTFALMEDSGWYLPNYDLAENIEWGKGLGCDFAQKSCMEILEMKDERFPFCNTVMQSDSRTYCTHDSRSVGSCNLVQFAKPLPTLYQNFNELEGVSPSDISRVGSSVTLADFCPYIQEFTWKSTSQSKERGTRCAQAQNAPVGDNNYALEQYGNGTRCFEQGGKWEQKSCRTLKQWKRYGAGCYPYECKDGGLNIVVRNVSLPCSEEGQVIDVRLKSGKWLHEGTVVCPKCEDICSNCQVQKQARTDPDLFMDDVENTCFEGGANGLNGFFSTFGFSLNDNKKR